MRPALSSPVATPEPAYLPALPADGISQSPARPTPLVRDDNEDPENNRRRHHHRAADVSILKKWAASQLGVLAASVPAGVINTAAAATGAVLVQGKAAGMPALKSSAAAGGIVLAADMLTASLLTAFSHLTPLDRLIYRNADEFAMLKKKAIVAAVISTLAQTAGQGFTTNLIGDAVLKQHIGKDTAGLELGDKIVGSKVLVASALAATLVAGGTLWWLYKTAKNRNSSLAPAGIHPPDSEAGAHALQDFAVLPAPTPAASAPLPTAANHAGIMPV